MSLPVAILLGILPGGCLSSGPAHAGPVDVFGFDARTMGRGGGGLALSDGPGDLFRNPSLLQRLPAPQVSFGYAMLRGGFDAPPPVYWDTNQDGRIDDTDDPLQVDLTLDRADGFMVGLARPVGKRFGIGLAAFLPLDRLLRIRTFEPSLPTWFLYENRLHRFELTAGFGWQQLPGISVGGAVEMLARTRFRITTTLEVRVRGAQGGDTGAGDLVEEMSLDTHAIEIDLVPNFAPVASLSWDVGELIPPLRGLQMGATYRGSTGLPVDVIIDLQGNVAIEDVGDLEPMVLTLIAPIQLDLYDHYVPERLTVGIAWDKRGPVRGYFDLERTWWNRMRLNVAQVSDGEVQSQVLKLSDTSIHDGNDYTAELGATTAFDLGAEVAMPELSLKGGFQFLRLSLRAGGGLHPSPLKSQGPTSSLLDADRLQTGVGLGIAHADPFHLVAGPLRWDLAFSWHQFASGALDVGDQTPYRAGAPLDGAPVPVGGHLLAAALQWSFEY